MPRVFLLAVLLTLGLPAAASAKAPSGFVGMVSEDSLAGDTAYREVQFKKMRAAKITLLRQTFDWAAIEREPGVYDFSVLDGFVGAAAFSHIQVMPVLFNPPPFRSSRPERSTARGTYPPKRRSDMARFATAAAKRYGPKGSFWRQYPFVPRKPVRVWQVWNEPNLKIYWRPSTNARAYVRLLKTVSIALHKVDRRAEVVSAGLPNSRAGVPLTRYVSAMLKAGAARWMNTLAVNPYAKTSRGVVGLLRDTRRLLNRRGGRRVSLRATELGWSDVGPRSDFKAGKSGQARRITSLIKSLGSQRRSLKLRGFVYFNWKDADPYPGFRDFWGLHTGLYTITGLPKRALKSFRSAVRRL